VRADGTVSMCCFHPGRKLLLGDLNSESLGVIINSMKVKEIQDIHNNRKILSSDLPCRNCDQLRDRTDALIYTSDKNMKVGKKSLFRD
jgi:radical SAM protein with 4Fe4S-binding SPASM domain